MIVEIILPQGIFEKTRYKLVTDYSINGHVVPAGYITDGATVPRCFWSIFPPTGRYFIAAVLHDYLLDTGCCWRTANKEFKAVLEKYGVKKWVVWTLYTSVQIYQFFKREVFRVKGNECDKTKGHNHAS